MATEKKVMDVANSKDAKVEIGSKPMIVGHKSMASDPMVREKEEDKKVSDDANNQTTSKDSSDQATAETENKPAEENVAPPSTKQKTIQPLTVEKPETATKADETSNDKSTKVEAEQKAPDDKKSDTEEKDGDKKIEPEAEAMERDENIRKLVESKKYFVDIKQADGSGKKMICLLAVMIIALLLGLFLLIDTGKLDLGFKLPFSVFGKDEVAKIEPKVVEPTNEKSLVSDDADKLFSISEYKFSIPKKQGWQYTSTTEADTPVLGFEIKTDTGYTISGFTVTGKGGDCQPATGDIPHSLTNVCQTEETIEVIETDNGYLKKNKLTVIKTQDNDAKSTYGYCYQPKKDQTGNPTTAPIAKTPQMGFVIGCGPDDIFIRIKANDAVNTDPYMFSTDSGFFDKKEIVEIESQLKSINFN
jgi:hypothetical protein